MTIKKPILLLFIVICATFSMMAQTPLSVNEENTFKAKVQQTAQNTTSIVSDFSQMKHLSVLHNVIASEGKLVFKAPHLVKWEYVKPYHTIAIFKNDALLVSNEGKKDEIDLSTNKVFRSLNTLIVNSIKGDMFDESQFEITYFKSENGYLVKFIPKDKRMKKFMASFELKFSKADAEVTEVKLIEPNDDYTLIIFKNRKVNAPVSEAVFTL